MTRRNSYEEKKKLKALRMEETIRQTEVGVFTEIKRKTKIKNKKMRMNHKNRIKVMKASKQNM